MSEPFITIEDPPVGTSGAFARYLRLKLDVNDQREA